MISKGYATVKTSMSGSISDNKQNAAAAVECKQTLQQCQKLCTKHGPYPIFNLCFEKAGKTLKLEDKVVMLAWQILLLGIFCWF